MMKQFEVLEWAFSFLKKYHREPRVAEILLQHLTKQRNPEFYMTMHERLDETIKNEFIKQVKRHAELGMPIQHIMGVAHFYGREFIVNEDVLIPRFETEELVQHTIEGIKQIQTKEPLVIADIGTGSGVIAITLALELENVIIYATDISERALQVANQNASRHDVDVTFLHGDFLQPLIKKEIKPNIIISNPPYIAENERYLLTDTVEKFDPHLALFAGNDGLAAYETIITQTKQLSTNSLKRIMFEIGFKQAKLVTNIVRQTYPESDITIYKDINKNDRIVQVCLHSC